MKRCPSSTTGAGARRTPGPAPHLTLVHTTQEADYICYEPTTSRLRFRAHHLAEPGHILGGPTQGLDSGGSLVGRLLPTLDPEMVKRVLGRVNYTTEQKQEGEAELLASLIRARTGQRPLSGDDSGANVALAVTDALRCFG